MRRTASILGGALVLLLASAVQGEVPSYQLTDGRLRAMDVQTAVATLANRSSGWSSLTPSACVLRRTRGSAGICAVDGSPLTRLVISDPGRLGHLHRVGGTAVGALPDAVQRSLRWTLQTHALAGYTARALGRGLVEVKEGEEYRVYWNPNRFGIGLIQLSRNSAPTGLTPHLLRLRETANVELTHLLSAYRTDRDLREYGASFGPLFSASVAALGSSSHWIDLGAGHAMAQRSLIASRVAAGQPVPRLTANSLDYPTPAYDEDGLPNGQPVKEWLERGAAPKGFRYLLGRTEGLGIKQLGKSDLITDEHGAFYYSRQPDKVLERALSSLRPGGRFFALVSSAEDLSWLHGVEGARLEVCKPGSLRCVVFERTPGRVRVPRVELARYQMTAGSSDDPVQRRVRVLSGRWVKPGPAH